MYICPAGVKIVENCYTFRNARWPYGYWMPNTCVVQNEIIGSSMCKLERSKNITEIFRVWQANTVAIGRGQALKHTCRLRLCDR